MPDRGPPPWRSRRWTASTSPGAARRGVGASGAAARCRRRACTSSVVDRPSRCSPPSTLRQESTDGPARLVHRRRRRASSSPTGPSGRARSIEQAASAGGGRALPGQHPIGGEMAFVFTAAGAAYHGMGAQLLRAIPEIIDPSRTALPPRRGRRLDLRRRDPSADAERLPVGHGDAQPGPRPADARRARPRADSGDRLLVGREQQPLRVRRLVRHGRDAPGDRDERADGPRAGGRLRRGRPRLGCRVGRLGDVERARAPLAEVEPAIAAELPRVHLAIVNTADDVVIAATPRACDRVVVDSSVGDGAVPLDYNVACHVPEVATAFHQQWLDIHTRDGDRAPGGLRFYSNGAAGAYAVSTERVCRGDHRAGGDDAGLPRHDHRGVRRRRPHLRRARPGWRMHELRPRDPPRPRHRRRPARPPPSRCGAGVRRRRRARRRRRGRGPRGAHPAARTANAAEPPAAAGPDAVACPSHPPPVPAATVARRRPTPTPTGRRRGHVAMDGAGAGLPSVYGDVGLVDVVGARAAPSRPRRGGHEPRRRRLAGAG